MSKYIFGCHEPMPFDVMPRGWILFLAEVGHSSDEHPGIDFTPWSDAGYGVICRIQHAWGDGGCLPAPDDLEGYLQRVETLTRNSRGCARWVPGNEPNLPREWPNGEALLPEYTAGVYNACRAIIDGEVILPPIGPWYVSNGIDWIEYFVRMINACSDIDAFALHTYSRGPDPASITSEQKMDAPYQHLYNGFRTYRDWMAAIPQEYRDRPAYITETDENEAWLNKPSTWIQEAYREIDSWNQDPDNQAIRAMVLYRWPKHDPYYIEGKTHVIDDFLLAQKRNYEWNIGEEPPGGGEVAWKKIFETSMEAFYDYQNIGEVTIPDGSVPVWEWDPTDGVLDRAEFDSKIDPQPEVHTKPMSAGFFSMYSTMQAALVWPVQVTPGSQIRASIWAMGVDGGGDVGQVLGISTTNPGEGAVASGALDQNWYGAWWAANMDEWVEREWRQLWGPIVTATSDTVWVIARGITNLAGPGHTHWDDLIVEIDSDAPPVVDPPIVDGTLNDHLDAIQAAIHATQGALDATRDYVDRAAVQALVV